MADDLHELVRALGIEQRPLVVGHSYGGVVATAYAARFPARGAVTVDQTLDVKPLPARMAQALRGENFADVMAMRQPIPFLSLHGLPVTDEYSAWLRSRIPGAVVETSPTVTHYPHLADPSWFVQRLIAFDRAHSG
ncbi:alpha/beta fold hydrolase [Micromonospora sp. NPDC049374]|uniref:alpha/beta fold hydrolase n=1 Tax=Micromonospora sp. NPDC049374 TaxID=3154352 RepID=UPI00342DB7A6